MDDAADGRCVRFDDVLFAGLAFRSATGSECTCGGGDNHFLRVFRGSDGKPAFRMGSMGLFRTSGQYIRADMSEVYLRVVLPVSDVFRCG